SRFFRSETPRTIAQPTETWLLDRYAQPRLFFNDFHVRWTNLRGPARLNPASDAIITLQVDIMSLIGKD
ncbi:MAG: hypothetical protein WBM01_13965, partial [Mycobacterium sp.]